MKVGLIGPPLSGKSTLMAAIVGKRHGSPPEQEFTATVKIPDDRLDALAKVYRPKRVTHASLEFVDFPGLCSSDESGKERYRKHLPQIRLCDVLVAVVRDFSGDAVPAHKDRIDPQADLDGLHDDFIFADLEGVMGRIERIEKSLKKATKSHEQEKKELTLLQRCLQALENLQPLSTVLQHPEDAMMLKSFAFLSEKPLVVVVNVSEDRAAADPAISYPYARSILNISAEVESEMAELEPADRKAFLTDLGLSVMARERLIQCCYQAAGLISFLTTGPDEVRAWPLRKDSPALEAAGKIHTDIARGFIRAETMAYADWAKAGGDEKAVRAAGRLRQEGKDYIVRDGDIILFRFNV